MFWVSNLWFGLPFDDWEAYQPAPFSLLLRFLRGSGEYLFLPVMIYPYEFLHLKCFAQRSSHDSCNKSDSILVSFQVASHISIWGKHKSFIYFIEKLTSCHLFTNVGKFAHSCLTIDAFSVYTSSDFSSMNETLFALTELSGPFILSNICTCLQQPVGLVIGSQTGGRDKLTPINMARDSASHVPFAISSPIFHFTFERHFIFPDLSYILNVMVSCMPQR